MLARLRPLALLALLLPGSAVAQVTAPGNVTLCADLAMEVSAKPKGRELMTVTLRISNKGPGDYPGVRGGQWVEHVVTVAGAEVERKKNGFTSIPAGGKKEFTFTRAKADGDFGIWALIQFAPGAGDCNAANNSAVTPVAF